jgi:NAD+ diphosphatase
MSHPLNRFRFCPCCGSNGFNPLGSRSLKCIECGFHWYVNSAAAVACLIFNEEGKLLVTRRAVDPDKGKIDLPGGFVDPLETAEQAVYRELHEELGMQVKAMRYITSHANEYLFSGITVFTTDLAFRVEAANIDTLVAADDISEFMWINPDDITEEEVPAPSIRYFIKEIAPNEKDHH